MDKVISQKNFIFIREVINELSSKLGVNDPKEILWLIYGSYVINMNHANSDLDMMGIHASFTPPKRMALDYKNVSIHLSTITMKDLKDDGETRLYGSYFTGKIINPHIFIFGDRKSRKLALYHAGKFISPMAGYIGKLTRNYLYSPSQITALVFITYLNIIGPSFDLVFLNYFISPEFDKVWKYLCENTILMLKTSGGIKQIKDKYVFTQKFDDYKSFHFERMKIAARHWSYVAVSHSRGYKFQDWLFSKTEEKMRRIDPTGKKYKKLISFLKSQSGLSNIYI